jgi:2-polyprenyl-6-methoxyphenol hydroxylase-like FAD-dependent oxidoreductase
VERTLDIAIVGYGIAGIAAAIHLRRSGHRISHFERNDPPVACGAGMLLHPAALRELDKLGVADMAVECGAPVRRICAQTVQGRALLDFSYGDAIDGQCGLGIQRGTLHRLLSSADSGRAQVFSGSKVIAIDPGSGFVQEEEGFRHGPFDLIVVADGTHSLLREQLVRAARFERGARAAALVGLLDDPQRLAADRLVQYFDSTRHLSVWPVGRAAIGEPVRCAIAINLSHDEAEALRDEEQRRWFVTRLSPRLRAMLDGRVENASLRVFSYHDVELEQTCVGRAVILGDAAHSMSPQLGTGAQLAMEDAASLARVMDRYTDVSSALREYTRIRAPQLRRYHAASRRLTSLFQSQSRAMAFLRDHLFASAVNSPSARRFAHELFS